MPSDRPTFDNTKVIHPIITYFNQQLVPEIEVSIEKGFFQVDGKWTCQRRNYITVSCSFSFWTSYEGQLYLGHSNHQAEVIKQFAVSISAKTNNNQESEVIALVQHTPKRDNSTSIPGKVTIQPSSGALSFNGNYNAGPIYSSMQHPISPTSHAFERIQFQKSTKNGKRRVQQYFHIVVELFADVNWTGESPNWVKVAEKQSGPLVVRGRCPGHYKENGRPDNTGSMGPDCESGASGAGLSYVDDSHGGRKSMGRYRRAKEQRHHSSDISVDSTDLSNIDPALLSPRLALDGLRMHRPRDVKRRKGRRR